ncbi:YdcF family protein [Saccharopolyspora sp. HNM0983]|uniref:YdcF family protein n=1 Tax=Saccharopolyspora montiporae TaxID=2781240 RepID=A0A929BA33_9PSEU|nr:YdcF family protein [Saccharopolyspora sp. HNM0983]MBE9376094.1 YdcF family protein [Saccharopolyspora sp. HNM0983]
MIVTDSHPGAGSPGPVPQQLRADVQTLWEYHRLDHEPKPVDVAIGLGSHDPGVPVHAAQLYARGLFDLIVFTGANAPTSLERFPRGEAVHYREIALDNGIPDEAILLEPDARNTGENIALTRDLLRERGVHVGSALLVSKPYQQRRALATARKLWPEVEFGCTAQPQTLDEHVQAVGDAERVISMLVGDTQRITSYARRGFAVEQDVPEPVQRAFARLVTAGYTRRLLPE